jgi:hypothetical protein
MARFFCAKKHEHATMEQARNCTGAPPAALPQPRPAQTIDPARPRAVVHVDADPTLAMLEYVSKLPHGDVEYAATLKRGACARYIKSLAAARDAAHMTVAMAVASAPPASSIIPVGLLSEVPNGRFAVRADSTRPWIFLRITRPRSGNFAGMLKVQSQHAERYALVLTVDPQDVFKWYDRRLEDDLLLLIADYQMAAIHYSQEKELCCRCGTQLTHDDSLRYGIGPECIKHWPWVPERLEQYKADQHG